MRDALKLSPKQVVSDAIANSRLKIVMQRVAVGEMSLKQLETWENEQAVRIKPPAGG